VDDVAGEVVGPHGHERDAADRRAEAAAQAPTRQGILPPRRWKVSSLVKTRDGHQKRYRASAERIINGLGKRYRYKYYISIVIF
jgi:hypothetical protein